MRCLQFDKETINALQFLGFSVEDDKEGASVETTVSVIHYAGNKCPSVSISLPCGVDLAFEVTPGRIQKIAQEWARSQEEEAEWAACQAEDEETMEHSHG
jgi:hypothetical protein